MESRNSSSGTNHAGSSGSVSSKSSIHSARTGSSGDSGSSASPAYPEIFRERIIPRECIHLKGDKILFYDGDHLVTSWKAIHPRPDLSHGYSCCFFREGYKVSEFYGHNDELLYTYCDIIKGHFKGDNNLIITDLLVDVIVYPKGTVRVVDVDELVAALNEGNLSLDDLKAALLSLNKLLDIIYDGRLSELTGFIKKYLDE